jgi:hypothetical protein
MRFKTLKNVIALVVITVIAVSVSVTLVRKYVFPAPAGEHHGQVQMVQELTSV